MRIIVCSLPVFLLLSLVAIVECIGAKSLCSKLTELQKSRLEVADGFELGTLLHIRGNISTYSGQREIKALYCGVWTIIDGHFLGQIV